MPVQNVNHITELILTESLGIRMILDNWKNKERNDKKNPDKVLKNMTGYTS